MRVEITEGKDGGRINDPSVAGQIAYFCDQANQQVRLTRRPADVLAGLMTALAYVARSYPPSNVTLEQLTEVLCNGLRGTIQNMEIVTDPAAIAAFTNRNSEGGRA